MAKRKAKGRDKWIQSAEERMERKGTRGKFGRATDSKIAKGKAAGGVKEKEAVFAQNMRKIARNRHRRGRGSSRR